MKKLLILLAVLAFVSCNRASYTAGSYEGSGEGHCGIITVDVTVTAKRITSIIVTDNPESGFIHAPMNSVIASVIEANSADVDTISGATESSEGIRTAIQNALIKAKL
jgi:uncharacterized protein with FMN-binding domain